MTFLDAMRCVAQLARLAVHAPAVLVQIGDAAGPLRPYWVPDVPTAELVKSAIAPSAGPSAQDGSYDCNGPSPAPAAWSRLLPVTRVPIRARRHSPCFGELSFVMTPPDSLSDTEKDALERLAALLAWQHELEGWCLRIEEHPDGTHDARGHWMEAVLQLRDALALVEEWLSGLDRRLPVLSAFRARMTIEAVRHVVVLMRQRCRTLIEHHALMELRPKRLELDVNSIARSAAERVGAQTPAGWLDLEPLPAACGDPYLLDQVFEDVLRCAVNRPCVLAETRLSVRGHCSFGHSIYRFIDNAQMWDAATTARLLSFVPRAGATASTDLLPGELAMARLAASRQGGQLCVVRDSDPPGRSMVCLILPAPEAMDADPLYEPTAPP